MPLLEFKHLPGSKVFSGACNIGIDTVLDGDNKQKHNHKVTSAGMMRSFEQICHHIKICYGKESVLYQCVTSMKCKPITKYKLM